MQWVNSSNTNCFHTWDCSSEHSPRCTRTFGCGGCPSMQQSGLSVLLFCVPLYDLLWFLVHCCLCIWNQHCLGWRIFCTYSRFPETSVSERQTSRIFWTIRNSRFSETLWAEQHPEFVLLASQVHTWEYFVLPGFFGLLEESCPKDTPCRETRQHALAFTFDKEN